MRNIILFVMLLNIGCGSIDAVSQDASVSPDSKVDVSKDGGPDISNDTGTIAQDGGRDANSIDGTAADGAPPIDGSVPDTSSYPECPRTTTSPKFGTVSANQSPCDGKPNCASCFWGDLQSPPPNNCRVPGTATICAPPADPPNDYIGDCNKCP